MSEQTQDQSTETTTETKTVEAQAAETKQETQQTEQVDWKAKFEELQSSTEGLVKKKEELLGSVKSLKEELDGIKNQSKEQEIKAAEENGDKDKLLEFARAEVEDYKAQLEEMRTKEETRKEKLLYDAKVAEFQKRLPEGVEIFNLEDTLDKLELDKFVLEEDGKWNEVGVKQAMDKVFEKYPNHFKGLGEGTPGHAPKGSSKDKGSSTQDRIKKHLLG